MNETDLEPKSTAEEDGAGTLEPSTGEAHVEMDSTADAEGSEATPEGEDEAEGSEAEEAEEPEEDEDEEDDESESTESEGVE